MLHAPTVHAAALGAWQEEASIATARWGHAATLLPDGNVLVAGGYSDNLGYLSSAESYNPTTNTWSGASNMAQGRAVFTATLLQGGKVLVAGGYDASLQSLASTELYDPATNTWSHAGAMTEPRAGHTATLLSDGRVLVVGGGHTPYVNNGSYLATAELYDPASNSWASAASLTHARSYQTATLLHDGRVVVAGGCAPSALASTEVYDPVANTWTMAGNLAVARCEQKASLLGNGQVLIAGGSSVSASPTASAEEFDPSTMAWAATGSMSTPRTEHAAITLADGTAVDIGGNVATGAFLASTEVYNPVTRIWTTTGAMHQARQSHTAVLLPDSTVLVVGGYDGVPLASVERFTPPDTTPPTTIATLSGLSGQDGWYISSVTLTLSANDNAGGSGVALTRFSTDGGASWQTYTRPVLFSSDGHYTVTYASTDVAGNVESVRVITFKIDQTPPTISFTGIADGAAYVLGAVPTPSFQVTDASSGVAVQHAVLSTPGTASGAGSYSYSVTATDYAGNVATKTAAYHVDYVYGGLILPGHESEVYHSQQLQLAFALTDAAGNSVSDADATLAVNSMPATSHHEDGASFAYARERQLYTYLLNTAGIPDGTVVLSVVLDDGTLHVLSLPLG